MYKPVKLVSYIFIGLLVSCTGTHRLSGRLKEAAASGFYFAGRALSNSDGSVTLASSAASLTFRFSGSSCTVFVKNAAPAGEYNYINIETDGVYAGRKKVDGSLELGIDVLAGGGQKIHTVTISKATEAANGQVIITRLRGTDLSALSPAYKGTIEFIGNSITCAYGSDMEIPCGNGSKWYDQHNAYWSYASRVARELQLDFMISAISGAGIYRNWNSEGPTVPQQYENAFLNTDSSLKWDFTRFSPAIVCIALGTNDLSGGDGKKPRLPFDSSRYINTYKQFIRTVYLHYPETQLVLLNSPMVGGDRGKLLEECLTDIKNGINTEVHPVKPVKLFFFNPMNPTGCAYHPSKEEEGIMADQLAPFIKKLIP